MKNLADLVEQSWLDAIVADTTRRAHPLRFPLMQKEEAWSRWRKVLDVAIGDVIHLLRGDVGARRRLVGKVKDRRQFWSTVPEIVWAARLNRLGMDVDVEPILGRRGPDLRFTQAGFLAHAEVYSPVFEADEFDWAEDLDEDLERLHLGYHVGAEVLPARVSQHRGLISKTLRRVIGQLAGQNDASTRRLYLRQDRSTRIEIMPHYISADFDPFMEQERKRGVLFVADLTPMPGMTGVTVGAHASNAFRNPGQWLTDLGQLQPGANLLIVDTSRDFVTHDAIVRSCDNAFARHHELSAIAVSSWGVYPAPTTNPLGDHRFIEEYSFIENPRATTPFPAKMIDAMGRSGLLDSVT